MTSVAQDGVLKQVIKGVWPFFCVAFGGMLYGLTVRTVLLISRAGVTAVSEAVFERDQTTRSLDAPLPFASGAASDLKKYSVPFRLVENFESGEVEGQTVKPGLPGRPAPGLPTIPIVSIWT